MQCLKLVFTRHILCSCKLKLCNCTKGMNLLFLSKEYLLAESFQNRAYLLAVVRLGRCILSQSIGRGVKIASGSTAPRPTPFLFMGMSLLQRCRFPHLPTFKRDSVR